MQRLKERTQSDWDALYDEAKQEYSLVAVVESYGVPLRKLGSWYVAACPFGGHRGKNKGNFNIKENGTAYTCRSCGKGGDVLTFVREMEDLPHTYAAIEFLQRGFKPSPVQYQPVVAPPVIPLDANENDPYHRALLTSSAALKLWQAEGVNLHTITHFQLGYCAKKNIYCGFHERPETHATLTIPVFERGELLNIRHRVLNPCNPHDKYRPEKANQGAAIFNYDVLDMSTNRDEVLIVAGEKKVCVLQQHIDYHILPVISATAGCTNWYSAMYRDAWRARLADRERIYIGFDPGEEEAAQRTAALFGRHAYLVEFADKPDDMIIAADGNPDSVLDAVGASEALRSRSIWL